MENISRFSVYTATILQQLYVAFPIPYTLETHSIIENYIAFEKDDELRSLKLNKEFSEIFDFLGLDGGQTTDQEQRFKHKQMLLKIVKERKAAEDLQRDILDGTIDFLVSEGLIRRPDSGGYVLTAKAFAHLNMDFTGGEIADRKNTFIQEFGRVTGKVGVGVAIKVVSTFFGAALS